MKLVRTTSVIRYAQRVTLNPAQKLGAQRVVGVDIDAELVALAWKRRRHLWSLQKPGSGNQGAL